MAREIDIIEDGSPVETFCVDIPIEGQPQGRPESLSGKFLGVSSGKLLRLLSRREAVRIGFAGSRYRFASLTTDGDFELVRDWTVNTLRDLEVELNSANRVR
jgi:hypothetical protein